MILDRRRIPGRPPLKRFAQSGLWRRACPPCPTRRMLSPELGMTLEYFGRGRRIRPLALLACAVTAGCGLSEYPVAGFGADAGGGSRDAAKPPAMRDAADRQVPPAEEEMSDGGTKPPADTAV